MSLTRGVPSSLSADTATTLRPHLADRRAGSSTEQSIEGELGAGIMHFYEVMLDPAASHEAVKWLGDRLLTAVGKVAPVTGATTIDINGYRVTVGGLVDGVLDLTLDRIAQTERTSVTTVMSRDGLAGVGRYLSGPVRLQLEDAGWANGLIVPADSDLVGPMLHSDPGTHRLDFIFGHTHKPWHREVEGIHFVNTGSVGRPKDGDWRAGYVQIDFADGIGVEFRRVEYDIDCAVAGIEQSALPNAFGTYLRTSW